MLHLSAQFIHYTFKTLFLIYLFGITIELTAGKQSRTDVTEDLTKSLAQNHSYNFGAVGRNL